jgi:hypothetical protein
VFTDAARLMGEAWLYMPEGLLLDLCVFHLVVRWLDRRDGSRFRTSGG